MYSLYRAWFGDTVTTDNYTRLQDTLSPPDTVIRVGNEGEHQFVAHKGVLAAHSGYLKALLTNAANASGTATGANVNPCTANAITVTTTSLSGQSVRQPVTSVSVSSIGGEAFAPLLNYMYTGRLEVTLDNVYSVLLATHLLHMPGALEQCRAALLRLRAPPPLPAPILVPTGPTSTMTSTSMSVPTPGSGSVLRPIPNRLMIDPGMCWPTATPMYPATAAAAAAAPASIGLPHMPPQLQPSILMQSAVPLNVSIGPNSSIHDSKNYREVRSPTSTLYQVERSRGPRTEARPRSPETTSSAAFTTSNATTSSPPRSASPTSSSTSQFSLTAGQSRKSERRQIKEEAVDYERRTSSGGQAQHRASPVTSGEETIGSARDRDRSLESVSIDENDQQRSYRRKGRGSANKNHGSSTSGILSVVYDVACCDGPVRFHRVLNKNYSSSATSPAVLQPRLQRAACFEPENVSSENDENGGPPVPVRPCDPVVSEMDAANASGSYTCGYCRHTFKSQYCYRKHTKRHLLPTRANETAANHRQRQDVGRNRREVRLLDLNVQYYPCKICGCKFPSYYFVHKHRKLCHANADERTQEETAATAAEEPEGSTISSGNERQ